MIQYGRTFIDKAAGRDDDVPDLNLGGNRAARTDINNLLSAEVNQRLKKDDRIRGHEVEFARVHAGVTAMPRVGMNPYALGMLLFQYIEDLADKGRYSMEFQKISNARQREKFDISTGEGQDFIFKVREDFCDFMFVNTFLEQDFVTKKKLFVAGRRLNSTKKVYEYYIKSRKVEDYKKAILDSLYHPPCIEIDPEKSKNNSLYLDHHFEGRPLITEFITNTMMGIEYLWGGPVMLETSEFVTTSSLPGSGYYLLGRPYIPQAESEVTRKWERVLYTMENRKLSRKII